jgi:hypothetical protein
MALASRGHMWCPVTTVKSAQRTSRADIGKFDNILVYDRSKNKDEG